MKFNKEMWWWITPCILADIGWHFISLPTKYNIWAYFFLITLPTTIGIILLASFFRDPDREPEAGYEKDISILSPTDGYLIAIEKEEGNLVLFIEMHYNDAHVARAHLSGTVINVTRIGGAHHWVYFFKKQEDTKSLAIRKNARAIIEFEDNLGRKFLYYLICGAFFRRAKPYVEIGDKIQQGQRIGMIVFGSTIKITIPGVDYDIISKIGEKVKGGHTIICKKKSE